MILRKICRIIGYQYNEFATILSRKTISLLFLSRYLDRS